jgi:hypothetical protein
MAQTNYTPISLYHSTTAAAVPLAANLVAGELALNIEDMKLYCENAAGTVTLLASNASSSGDVAGPASATDKAIATFDGTTGKLIQNNSGNTIGTTGNTVISVTDNTNAALRITQLGTGNALLVEDSTNPDASPFVIDATGKVGIGTTAPLFDLHIQADTSTGVLNYTAGGETSYLFRRSSGTASAPTIVVSGDTVAATAYQGYDGASYLSAAQIIGAIDGTPGTNDMPGRLVFSTTADGASSVTERMRINSAGAIGFGGANFGTSGQILTSAGTAASPTWETFSGLTTGKSIALAMIFGF